MCVWYIPVWMELLKIQRTPKSDIILLPFLSQPSSNKAHTLFLLQTIPVIFFYFSWSQLLIICLSGVKRGPLQADKNTFLIQKLSLHAFTLWKIHLTLLWTVVCRKYLHDKALFCNSVVHCKAHVMPWYTVLPFILYFSLFLCALLDFSVLFLEVLFLFQIHFFCV